MKLKSHLTAIIVSVLAILIAAALEYFFSSINIFDSLWSFLKWMCGLFFIKINTPIWFIILLIIIPYLCVRIVNFFREHSTTVTYRNYRSDDIYGVKWYWDYLDNKIYEDSIFARCPECKMRLDVIPDSVYEPSSRYHGRSSDVTRLKCQNCNFEKTFECIWRELLAKLTKEIDRNIHTGEYVNKIKK